MKEYKDINTESLACLLAEGKCLFLNNIDFKIQHQGLI